MPNASPELVAQANLIRLGDNPYPGRLIIAGRNQGGDQLVQLYALMGRSENSRNCVLAIKDGRVFTEFADPSKGGDPSLVIYNAMSSYGRDYYVVSNGKQTDTVARALGAGGTLSDGLAEWSYEPDEPNYTPRITAVCTLRDTATVTIGVLRRSICGLREEHVHSYDGVAPGFGYGVHTYQGDGNPLPAWEGVPLLFPLEGKVEEIATCYWELLSQENRVALAVRFIDDGTGEKSTYTINAYGD